MLFIKEHFKVVVIGLVVLCALLSGVLIYREIDARRVPQLAIESETGAPASTTPDATPTPIVTTPATMPISPTPTLEPSTTEPSMVTPQPSSEATVKPADSSPVTPKPGEYGTLTIRKKTFSLKRGVDEKTLAKDIGWMESSAPPGGDGVCVIMGHRNTQFRILKDVEKGDSVVITDATGATFTYIVKSARIVESDSELHFEASEGKTLALVTCYPFYFQGHAPHKYVVYARIMD